MRVTIFTALRIQYNMKMEEIPRRVHFVGVGGVSMSGLAQHLHSLGYSVSGSDRTDSDRTDALSALGIAVHIGHNAANIGDARLVVRTSAVTESNEEIAEAHRRGVPVVLREELLGAVFNSFDRRIAICGTHGKTTVTAMIHEVLSAAGTEHTALIGGVYRGNNWYGGSGTVVAEACEFNRSFLYLRPTLCVCLNAEYDHPDCYRDEEDVRRAFAQFLSGVDDSGHVILPSELKGLYPHRNRTLFDKAYTVQNLSSDGGKPQFDVLSDETVRIRLAVPGEHNVRNALATLAVAEQLGLPMEIAKTGLENFCGVDRRWTEATIPDLCRTVLDYAHHPTELACSVATAKSMTKGRVLCVFQPHTYTRTKAFWSDFAECFREADAVGYLPVYSAREKPLAGVNSYLLAQSAAAKGINACFLADFLSAKRWIYGNASRDDILLILGAGDVNKLVGLL